MMIFDEGYLEKYRLLRTKGPSIYNLEDLHYKAIDITYKDSKLYLRDTDLTGEDTITVNFPEFLDSATNLTLIKSIHFGVDLMLGDDIPKVGDKLNTWIKGLNDDAKLLPLPPDLYRLYLGYRHIPVIDVPRHLRGAESLTTQQLSIMEDDCFEWLEVTNGSGVKQKTSRTSVLKFKVTLDLDVLRAYLASMQVDKDTTLKFILHPPFMGRMSFKNSIAILYPYQTTKLKVLDRVSFRTNKSFVENSKLYRIDIVDKETTQVLFSFDSDTHREMFTPLQKAVVAERNSVFDKELVTFNDSVLVDFNLPVPVQMALAKHQNYKIRITAKDLTTQERI